MKNPLTTDTIDFPSDSKLTCEFNYDTTTWNSKINTTLLIRVREYLGYEFKDGKIESYAIESGDTFYDNILKVNRGFKADMTHEVH